MNPIGAILYVDSLDFLGNKSSAFNKGRRSKNSSPKMKLEEWTVEYLVDRLFSEMLEIHDDAQGWEDYQPRGQRKKYYDRARDTIKMAAGLPSPIFVINISDLTRRLKKELSELMEDTLDYVVNEAIGRICENVSPKLYHLTLKKCLGWRFEN